MAVETKIIVNLIAQIVAQSKSVEDAYAAIQLASNTEGALPEMNELLKLLQGKSKDK